jgi:predicted O-methyltransferase YrrM
LNQTIAQKNATDVRQLLDDLDSVLQEKPPQERLPFLGRMVEILAAHGFCSGEQFALQFFEQCQAAGMHFLPVHFYSPVPDTRAIPDSQWKKRFDSPGWNLNLVGQLELLRKLGEWSSEMQQTPLFSDGDPTQYFYENGQFVATDAVVLHSMIRQFRPSQILEIGSGHSTRVAARAARMNASTRLRSIEPYPSEPLRAGIPGLDELIVKPLQQVDPSVFDSLGAGDFLFVDSSHVGKIGSDVNQMILEILPRLNPGVIVHFHDIFLPEEYPRHWVTQHRLFWNEQYLLLSYLLDNPGVEVLLGTHYLGVAHAAEIRTSFPYLPNFGGSSFWFRRNGIR